MKKLSKILALLLAFAMIANTDFTSMAANDLPMLYYISEDGTTASLMEFDTDTSWPNFGINYGSWYYENPNGQEYSMILDYYQYRNGNACCELLTYYYVNLATKTYDEVYCVNPSFQFIDTPYTYVFSNAMDMFTGNYLDTISLNCIEPSSADSDWIVTYRDRVFTMEFTYDSWDSKKDTTVEDLLKVQNAIAQLQK